MPSGDIDDRDLIELAEETDRVAADIGDPAIRARLYGIANELRELALPTGE
jgi:hypothetical protein